MEQKKVTLELTAEQAQFVRSALVIYVDSLAGTACDAVANRPYDFERMKAFAEKAIAVDALHSYVCKCSGVIKVSTK